MLYKAKNGIVEISGGSMEYAVFGSGGRDLILLPGLGDALRSMKGMALPLALMYRAFAKDFRVWVFSRKAPLYEGEGTRDMALHQLEAMDALGIKKAALWGVSMGGMIAQHMAAEAPERFTKLVLTVTCARPNDVIKSSVGEWISLAEKGAHRAFMDSNMRLIYTEEYYRKNRWTIPLTAALTKPRSYERFFIMARACLEHDAFERLRDIKAETLIIGGEKDMSLGGEASREIAGEIAGSRLIMYENYGHGLYEEAKDFNGKVLEFLTPSLSF